MHHLSSISSAKPDSGPENSVPAIGCPGIKLIPWGIMSDTWLITSDLTDPTSVMIDPFFKLEEISFSISLFEPTGTHNIIRSASVTALT